MKRALPTLSLLFVALAPTVTAFGQRAEYDPWQVTPARLHDGVRVVAVPELILPGALEGQTGLQRRIEAVVIDKLRTLGFEIVPVLECEETWEQICNRLGGLDDEETHERDEEKFAAARKHYLNELQVRYNADAVVHAAIIGAPAFVVGKSAQWCGIAQKIDGLPGSLKRRPPGPPTGACLAVLIEDALGVTMYVNVHGLEIVVKPVGREWVAIPPEDLFTDPALIQAAVDETLDALGDEGAR